MRLAPLALLVLAACGDPAPADPACSAPPTYTVAVAPIFAARCLPCHSESKEGEARNGAPEGLDFDRLELFKDQLPAVTNALTSGTEPPVGARVEYETTAEERTTVSTWRRCGYVE